MIRPALPFAAVAATAAVLLAAGPAGADPVPTPNAAQLRQAASAAGQVSLIVHVSDAGPSVSSVARESGLSPQHTLGALGVFSVKAPASTVDETISRLENLPGVTGVERDVPRYFAGNPTNDPLWTYQQAYLNAVAAPAGWAKQHASSAIRIAIVDSGVDVTHPDLAGKIVATYDAADPHGGTTVTDAVGHGTFVAGVAAAETDNGLGVAGAGYNAAIMAVKIADSSGAIEVANEVAGIKWAADHGADIINLSLGGPDASPAESAAIAYAQHKGALVVAAAGNDGDTVREYPAAYPGVIAVGATDVAHHTRADFSDHGSWVTVAAPGVDITSTVPAQSQLWGSTPSRYAGGDGTSFSTPLVAGEAALLKAQNPGQGLSRLRAAVVASGHGYSGLGLGTGQVDFARGLAHVPPTTTPSGLQAKGSAGRIALTATSASPEVAFRIDDEATRAPVRVSGGSAATTFTSWGYANGTHTVRAYDCTAYGECSTHATSAQFSIANPASSITTPKAGAGVTGLVQVQATNPAGGPLRLLVDGHSAGSRSAAPYTFSFSASDLKDGPHSLVTQGCSSDYQRCSGPRSSAVSVRSQALHPTITGIAPWQFSPNADHVKDATTLTYRLPQSETVYAAVLDSHGTRVRYAPLGTQPAGTHTWVWHGKRGDGTRLPDGRYTVALDTRRGALRGWVHTSTIIDTRRPTLSHTAGANRLFYPVPDGYRDAFTPSTTTNSPGWLHLTIETLHGRTVQVVNAKRSAGLVRISWHGRDKHRHLVAPGTYRWRLALTDAAGNVGHTRWFKVRVSGKRLVRRTQYVTLAGARAEASGGTASCASARRSASAFAGGLYLLNRCSMNDFDLAYVSYHFHLPKAYRYDSVALQARGLSRYVPSELSAAFEAVDGSVAIPRYEKVGHYGTHWFPVASVGGRGHVSAHGYVRVSLLLDSYYSGRNDFDIESVRLRVRLTVLR